MAWVLDASHSSVEFAVKHMMITTVRGRFTEFSGTVNIDEQRPERSTVEGTVETATIDTRDANRDGHLRSADFFDVENYPTISFRSTRIEGLKGDRFKVVGDLTIKDVTREVVFDVTNHGQAKDPWGNTRASFSGTTTINRKDFGLNWNVALETGGWLVADQVKIEAEVQLIQEQPQPEEAAAVLA